MTTLKPKLRDDYLALIRRFPLAPIRSARAYNAAVAVVDDLSLRAESSLTRGESDYLDVLVDLIEKYESAAAPAETVEPLDALRELLEQHGMTASDLGRLLGNRQIGSAILRGSRGLSKSHIARLAEHFKVSPALFLR